MAAPKNDIDLLNDTLQLAYDAFWRMMEQQTEGGLHRRTPLLEVANKEPVIFDAEGDIDMIILIRINDAIYRADFNSFEK